MGLETIELWYTQWGAALGWPGECVVRLLLATLLGLLIGMEREYNGHEAGLRTHALVCVGCAMTMLVSLSFANIDWRDVSGSNEVIQLDPARLAYGVMAGIGFLGAGAIIHMRGNVRGLTTAAGIWCAAAIGLGVGLGLLIAPIAAVLIVLTLLYVLDPLSKKFPRERVALGSFTLPSGPTSLDQLRARFAQQNVSIRHVNIDAVDGERMRVTALMVCTHADLQARVMRVAAEDEAWRLRRFKWVAD